MSKFSQLIYVFLQLVGLNKDSNKIYTLHSVDTSLKFLLIYNSSPFSFSFLLQHLPPFICWKKPGCLSIGTSYILDLVSCILRCHLTCSSNLCISYKLHVRSDQIQVVLCFFFFFQQNCFIGNAVFFHWGHITKHIMFSCPFLNDSVMGVGSGIISPIPPL